MHLHWQTCNEHPEQDITSLCKWAGVLLTVTATLRNLLAAHQNEACTAELAVG